MKELHDAITFVYDNVKDWELEEEQRKQLSFVSDLANPEQKRIQIMCDLLESLGLQYSVALNGFYKTISSLPDDYLL